MLNQIMTQINNHFSRSLESQAYEIVTDGIVGTFSETYIKGQYIWIKGSFINDGVYKIDSVTTSKITVEENLQAENTGEYMLLFGLAVPADFLTVATDIGNYTSSDGIKSESIGDYSVSYGGSSDGDGSWVSAFGKQLSKWNRMYDDDVTMCRRYNIYTKRC